MHFSAFVVAALKIGLDKLSIVARKTDAQQLLASAGSGMKEGECGGFLLISEDDNLKICPPFFEARSGNEHDYCASI